MSDETQLAPSQQPDQDTTAPAAEPNNTEPAATPDQHMIPKERFDEINNQLKALKAQQEKAQKEAEARQKKQLEEQNKFKELYEAEQKKAAEALATAERIQRERLQLEVATAGNAPSLWNRLQGETKEELEADLKVLLEAFPDHKQPAPNLNGGAGPGGRKPGKPAPTEAEIREQAARYGVKAELLAEQYGVQLPK